MNVPHPAPAPLLQLSPIEARVLGTLMEKARTVPDSYPLSLNSLVLGCNQKTSREPLMELDESQVLAALDLLQTQDLVRTSSGGRTARFEHNFQRRVGVPEQSAVLLGVLVLRGPQTAAELRQNTERWYRFADVSSVQGFLDELRDRPAEKGGPLATLLEREHGAREQRWAHLLSPLPAGDRAGEGTSALAPDAQPGTLHERVRQLEQDVHQLRQALQNLYLELGMSPPGQP